MKSSIKTILKPKQNTNITQSSSGIRTLRSIINEAKVPLSDYINKQRPSIEKNVHKIDRVRTKTSYFQKFKGMIGNNLMERKQEISFETPFKQSQPIENMQDQNSYLQSQTIDMGSRLSIYKRKLAEYVDRSRSKSTNQKPSGILNKNNQFHRKSFQPSKNVKTQTKIISKNDQRLPPKPINNKNVRKHLQIMKNLQIQEVENTPLSNRPNLRRQSSIQANSYVKRQHSEMKQQNSLEQIIQNIHSHRRLNFQKQDERRKQIIIYGKTHQKITQNRHSNDEVRLIETHPIETGQVLGHGAFSYVKIGNLKGIMSNKKLAIKIYEKYKLIQHGRKSRVLKEIQILSRLNHPNIVKLFCAFQNKRQIHILFEQIEESITLQEYFKHMNSKFTDGGLMMFIMKEVLKGLEYLHSLGMSHRDIKPDNILLSFKDRLPIVKLIDFGFATNSQVSNVYCGTPNFMAPELFMKKPYSPFKSDMWAFGVMMFYLFESKYPFKGFNEKDLMRNICQCRPKFEKTPFQIQRILSLLFQPNPQIRISARQFLRLTDQLQMS